jgi:hypothetical protein
MTAFHNMMLSGHGLPEMPPGGSLESRLKSRIRRLLQLVDYIERVSGKSTGDKQNELTMTVVTSEVGSLGYSQAAFLPCPSTRDWSALCHVISVWTFFFGFHIVFTGKQPCVSQGYCVHFHLGD